MQTRKLTKLNLRNLALTVGVSAVAFVGLSCTVDAKEAKPVAQNPENNAPAVAQPTQKAAQPTNQAPQVDAATEYGHLVLEREEVAQRLKNYENTLLVAQGQLWDEVDKLQTKYTELKNSYEEYEKRRDQVNNLKRTLEDADQEVEIANQKNWTVGREAILYLLALKPVWGLFTGYAPTTRTFEVVERVEKVKETASNALRNKEAELELAKTDVLKKLSEVETHYDNTIARTGSPLLRNHYLTSKHLTVTTYKHLLQTNHELDVQETLYREYLRQAYPTTPYAVAKDRGVNNGDYVGSFRLAALNEVKQRKAHLTVKLNALYYEEHETPANGNNPSHPGAANYAPSYLGKMVAQEVAKTNEERDQLQARLENLNQQLRDATVENPNLESEYVSSEAVQDALEAKRVTTTDGSATAKATELYKALEVLRKSAAAVVAQLEGISNAQRELRMASDKVYLREEGLREAKRNKYSFFREVGLYVLGFKWIWGGPHYQPSVWVEKEEKDLALAQEEKVDKQKHYQGLMNEMEGQFKRAWQAFDENYRVAKAKTTNAIQKQALLSYYANFRDATTRYQKEMENADSLATLVANEQVAATLYKTDLTGPLAFARHFGLSRTVSQLSSLGLPTPTISSNSLLPLEGQTDYEYPVALKEHGQSNPQAARWARRRLAWFVTHEGESYLAVVMNQLEAEIAKQNALRENDDVNQKVVAKITGLSPTANVTATKNSSN